MNNYIKRSLLLLFLITLSNASAFSQAGFKEGYLLRSNSDTIRGYIKYDPRKNEGSSVSFKQTKNASGSAYSPAEVVGFGFDSFNHYTTLDLNAVQEFGQLHFTRVLLIGKLSLYAVHEGYIVQKNDSFNFIPKKSKSGENGDDLRQLAKKLGGLVGDCSTPLFDNLKASLSENAIIKIAKGYNQCIDSEYEILSYDENLPKIGIQFGVSAGIVASGYSLGSDTDLDLSSVDFGYTKSGLLGASVLINSPRFSKEAGLFLAFQYQKSSFYGSERPALVPGNVSRDIFLDTNITRLMTGISFSKEKKVFEYFLRGGLSFNRFGSTELSMISDFVMFDALNNVSITRFESQPRILRNKAGFGTWISMGIQKDLTEKLRWGAELTYEKFQDDIGLNPSFNNFQFTISLYY